MIAYLLALAAPTTLSVELSPTVVSPADGLSGTEAEAGFEAPLWKTPLAIAESAVLRGTVVATVGGMSRTFRPGDLLWRAHVIGSGFDPGLSGGALYCGTRMDRGQWDDSEALRIAFRHDDWTKWQSRICLLDRDGDGRFESAVAAGKLKSGLGQSAIEPIAFGVQQDRPIPGATLQIRLDKGSPMQGRVLLLDGYYEGTKIGSVGIKMQPRGGGKVTHYRNWRPAKSGQYPAIQNFGDLQITVLSYDPGRQRVRARFDRAFYRTPVVFEEKGALIIPLTR